MTENDKTSTLVEISTSKTTDISLKFTALYFKEQEISNLIRHSAHLDFDRFNEIKLQHERNVEAFFGIQLNTYSNGANHNHLELYKKAIIEHIERIDQEEKINDFMLKLDDYFEDLIHLTHSYKILA